MVKRNELKLSLLLLFCVKREKTGALRCISIFVNTVRMDICNVCYVQLVIEFTIEKKINECYTEDTFYSVFPINNKFKLKLTHQNKCGK